MGVGVKVAIGVGVFVLVGLAVAVDGIGVGVAVGGTGVGVAVGPANAPLHPARSNSVNIKQSICCIGLLRFIVFTPFYAWSVRLVGGILVSTGCTGGGTLALFQGSVAGFAAGFGVDEAL